MRDRTSSPKCKARFAWKAFAQWQRRLDNTPEERKEKEEMFRYLKGM